ncbi:MULTISPECIES: DUF1932 domain-containing protein [unclassified Yoonia]|uniref:DUF1932 domain-containing protein n=1 Tax=unclassified Yoonia TaxID=2629118 RepID=UPI002AFF8707|nr:MULTISPECIES: DUF1932 domain-containing protein [unclassified Yoonia]
MKNIAFMGFGEAAGAYASGLREVTDRISAYDIKLDRPTDSAACLHRMAALNVAACDLAGLRDASLILCLVTADQALVAAQAAAPHLAAGALWCDGNSCAPDTKRQAAQVIAAAGARYVDLAIMAPVHPRLHHTPMLASGPDAATAVAALAAFEMQARVVGDMIGQASAIKMLRSVIIKGLEALTAEAFLAARAAGVEMAVIASLQASDPGIDWEKRGAYNIERMLVHGARRAAEMQEVAATLRALGLPDRMAQATCQWQSDLAALALDPGVDDLGLRADLVLQAVR